jgi:hypothetical protein
MLVQVTTALFLVAVLSGSRGCMIGSLVLWIWALWH